MAKNYTGGLNFTWPTLGESGWASTADTALTAISAHDHTGAGDGAQLSSDSIAANAITGAKILLANNEALRARNASATITDVLKYNASNELELLQSTNHTNGYFALSSTDTATASGAASLTTDVTILNGTSLAMTLGAGVAGQLKAFVNINSTLATITPGTTVGANTASLVQNGYVMFQFVSGEWRISGGQGYTVTDDLQAITVAGTVTALARTVTISNAGAIAVTLNPSNTLQRCTVINIGAGTATVTLTGRPAASDVATMLTSSSLELVAIGSVWQAAIPGAGCTLA